MAKIKPMNQKWAPPHFPAAKGIPMDGIYFTNKKATLRTFWGPLQERDDRWFAIDINFDDHSYIGYHKDYDSFNFDPDAGTTVHHIWEYIKPLDWRPGGSLLTPPQVVHLCINIFQAYSNADTLAGGIRLGSDNHSNNPDAEQYLTRFDAATAEQVRLVAACKDAAKKINEIRKGKTWVQVIDYQEGSIDNGGLTYPFDIDFPDNEHANVQNMPIDLSCDNLVRPVFLSLPNVFALPFYGTDFLQMYLGDEVFSPVNYGFVTIYPTFVDLPLWKFATDVLIKTIPSFHRYSVQLYPSDVGTALYTSANIQFTDAVAWSDSLPPLPTFTYSTTFADQPITFNGKAVEIHDYPDNLQEYHWIDPTGGAVTIPPEAVTLGAATILPSLSVFSVISKWSEENGYDIGLAGAASGMDMDSIINAIAKHFNFNATTGKDLDQ